MYVSFVLYESKDHIQCRKTDKKYLQNYRLKLILIRGLNTRPDHVISTVLTDSFESV